MPQGSFPPPREFQQANAEHARTTVGEEDLQAFKALNLTQQPELKNVDYVAKQKTYERQESTDSTATTDSEYEDGPPRQEEFGGDHAQRKGLSCTLNDSEHSGNQGISSFCSAADCLSTNEFIHVFYKLCMPAPACCLCCK